MKGCLLFFIIMLAAGSIRAQTIVTDRPDQTESSSTVPRRSMQIESGVLLGFTGDNLFSVKQLLIPTTLLRFGLTKSIELRVFNQFERINNQINDKETKGFSDLEIGAKINLLSRADINTEIAIISHVVLPTGAAGLTLNSVGARNTLSVSHQLSKNTAIGYNFGYNHSGAGKGELTYTLAVGTGITEKLSVFFEPYGSLNAFYHKVNINAGLTYLLKDNFQLDFSLGTGVNHPMNFASAGFSWLMHNKPDNKN